MRTTMSIEKWLGAAGACMAVALATAHCGSAPDGKSGANDPAVQGAPETLGATSAALGGDCPTGQIWDDAAGGCRAVKHCADLACAATQTCVEAGSSSDAQCLGTACAAGLGQTSSGACVTCANSPTCGGDGETGNVVSLSGTAGGACVCETRDGHYLNAFRVSTPCDSDGDGWVSDSAVASLEGNDASMRSQARCHVRHVKQFLLESEDGSTLAVPAVDATSYPQGLPLYESARDDGQAVLDEVAPYSVDGGRVLNSLTKACVDALKDYNHNGLTDVDEGSSSIVGDAFRTRAGANWQRLLPYYNEYLQFSYFVEMVDGWYEGPAGTGGVAQYHLRERKRTDRGGTGVPLQYTFGSTGYWQTCARNPDASYGATPESRVGADFSQFTPANAFHGLSHASQFKCVHVVTDDEYLMSGATPTKDPEVFTAPSGTVARGGSGIGWELSSCTAGVAMATPFPGADSRNPSRATVTCNALSAADVDSVEWAAVPRYDYGASGAAYQRGCVDQCKDPPNGGCSASAQCDSTNGGHTCTCNKGYSGNGVSCTDVDECATRTANCAQGTQCSNTPGSFTCVACPGGYTSDGYTCLDVNECATRTANCSAGTYCSNTQGSFQCLGCGSGYTSDGYSCSDINECAAGTARCSSNAACTNTAGSYTCSCYYPYTGNGFSCTPINFCATNHGGCSPAASCTSTLSGPVCECNTGFHGNGKTCTANPPPSCQTLCANDSDPALCTCLCQNSRSRIKRQC